MKVLITLETMKFHACHGVTAEERIIGGIYTVDISYTFFTRAVETDRIEDTINYAEIFDLVKEEMKKPARLLEHIAGRIEKTINGRFPQIEALIVKISKLNPPVNGEMEKASVTIKNKKTRSK